MTPAPRTCESCGRRIEWRKKWERSWDEVRYCSTACRKRRVGPTDRALESAILDLLRRQRSGGTVDVADAVRVVAGPDTDAGALTEPARRAARRLVASGEVEIVQRGSVVDPSTARGPIRVRRAR
ncbi:DUF2256 and DUF3253 domain-containing protein [Nocardioides dongxiaopingii]|uniref:DUF2256 and DUF3253 domain-containing protein n=1 Tax=Nocardioides sp. S-1144 TaxID=2582905 RepID=UPI001C9E4B4B|nr:DUF2256 and DUF3253 domain-containing protein [Nocardioides sp. S-1144]